MSLKELRESKGLSQREVARRMNLTQPAIFKIEAGKTTTATLRRYAEAIGSNWIEVCTAVDSPSKQVNSELTDNYQIA